MSASGKEDPRLPPGQVLTAKWPVLHYGDVPSVSTASFRLRVWGAVAREVTLDWDALRALPTVERVSDFHCVTTWSRYDNKWQGVLFRDLAAHVGLEPRATHVMLHGSDGYYTNVPVGWLMDDGVLLAWAHDGQPLTAEHGGPVRVVVPKLYAWKSAKWVSGVEAMESDRRGYWEERGYHNRGEPFAEERYSYQEE